MFRLKTGGPRFVTTMCLYFADVVVDAGKDVPDLAFGQKTGREVLQMASARLVASGRASMNAATFNLVGWLLFSAIAAATCSSRG
jgi:hypothetical protein